jgi:hypothetical protein
MKGASQLLYALISICHIYLNSITTKPRNLGLNFYCILELSIKSRAVGPELHPSFDASSPHSSQSHEILLNKGMKYWDSGLNARGARTFIATVYIAGAVIGWKRTEEERTGQTQFSTKFVAKLSFMPRWNPVYIFSCFLKSRPLFDQIGVSGAVFAWLHG